MACNTTCAPNGAGSAADVASMIVSAGLTASVSGPPWDVAKPGPPRYVADKPWAPVLRPEVVQVATPLFRPKGPYVASVPASWIVTRPVATPAPGARGLTAMVNVT